MSKDQPAVVDLMKALEDSLAAAKAVARAPKPVDDDAPALCLCGDPDCWDGLA